MESFHRFLPLSPIKESDDDTKEVYNQKMPGSIEYSANPQKWNREGVHGIVNPNSGPFGGYPDISKMLLRKQRTMKRRRVVNKLARNLKLNNSRANIESRSYPIKEYFPKPKLGGGQTRKLRRSSKKNKKK